MKFFRLRIVIALTALLLCPMPYAVAQAQKPLEAAWLARDFRSVELVSQLASPSALTVRRISDILQLGDSGGEEEDLGFETTRFDLAIGGGYTRLYVEGVAVKGRIAVYKIGIESSGSWPLIRDRIVELWKRNGGPEFSETDTGIVHVETNEAVLQSYKSSVSAALGEMKQVKVPEELKKSYEYLTSPLDCRVFDGKDGHTAIAALVDAKRIDLVENVLRGLSPSGRVHAALVLMKLGKSHELVLSPETLSTIEKLRNINVSITKINGCLVSHLTAHEILSEEK